jgi:hypothetical protein
MDGSNDNYHHISANDSAVNANRGSKTCEIKKGDGVFFS